MSILSRNSLKAEFISGTAATSSKFGDIIDSSYNKNDDSLVLGPTGMTGVYGLLGPTGGTYMGMYVSPYYAGFTGSSGQTGQTIFISADMYVFSGVNWIKFGGTSA
jgi:hypothetical protein